MLVRFGFAFILALCCAPHVLAGTAYLDPIFGVEVTKNIVYGTGATNNGLGSLNLRLDLYRPTDTDEGTVPANNPALVFIHGGGFTTGSKDLIEMQLAATAYASFGYTVATINYRLNGNSPPLEPGPAQYMSNPPPPFTSLPTPQGFNLVNAAVADANKAMQWMRDNAAAYGFDANRIGIGGGSAGAITALMQAYTATPELAPKVVLSLLGSMYGAEHLIQAGGAPAFIVGGMTDTVVPPQGSINVANRLTELGIYNELYMQPGVSHDVRYDMVFGDKTLIEHNIAFMARYLAVPEPASVLLAVLAVGSFMAVAIRQRQRRMER